MAQIDAANRPSRAGTPNKRDVPGLSKNWYLLAGVAVISSLGMAVAVSPLLGGQGAIIWPWARTGFVLLGGLALSVILLVVHLTLQQRKFAEIRGEVDQMEEDAIMRRRHSSQRLRALLNISSMMGSVSTEAKFYNHVTGTCLDLFQSEHASLMLLNADKTELKVQAVSGQRHEEEASVATRRLGEGLSGWVAKAKRAVLLSPGADFSCYPGLDIGSLDVTAAMVVPILLRDELIGILSVRSTAPGAKYNDEDLQALQVFAENIGTAIRHWEHVEWMGQTLEKYKASQPQSETPFTIEKLRSE